jgi:proline dehydrogenase
MRRLLLALSSSGTLKGAASGSGLASRAAGRFVAGETIEDAIAVVAALNAAGMTATLDHLGENVATLAEAERARDAYLGALDQIARRRARSGISLKLTALGLDLGADVAARHLADVVAHAARAPRPIFVRIDMEGSDYTQATLDIFRAEYARSKNVGAVIQSYLRRSDADIEALCALGAHVRLVKGAYLEPPELAYPDKADVDAAYVRQATRLLAPDARARGVEVALATHDETIIDWAVAHTRDGGIAPAEFEFQMLYGIRRDLQEKLARDGYRVRVYVPYGSEWYPYFMRRLAERPENVAFILRNLAR